MAYQSVSGSQEILCEAQDLRRSGKIRFPAKGFLGRSWKALWLRWMPVKRTADENYQRVLLTVEDIREMLPSSHRTQDLRHASGRSRCRVSSR